MTENGIELFAEADTFEMTAGTLLACLKPRHSAEISRLARHYNLAISALAGHLIQNVRGRFQNHPDLEVRRRNNLTISVIRRSKARFQRKSEGVLYSKLPYLRAVS